MIQFRKIRFKNFGSFGNVFTEINFEKSQTTLVCGNNGSGKSFALLDSLTFALFGKPFRKINIPQLQNSINTKECIVELFFGIGNDNYKVRRGLAPKVFEIYKNDKLINQEAKTADYQAILEEQIIKMNYKTFTQVVILGSSSFVPFMQLPASDRRAVIENILDINIFTTMNVLLKGKILSVKESLRDHNTKIEAQNQKIEYQNKIIDRMQNSVTDDTNQLESEIEELRGKIADLISEMQKNNESRISIDVDLNELEKDLSKTDKYLTQILTKTEQLLADKDFYEKEKSCPKCKGIISQETKEANLSEIQKSLDQYQEANNGLEKKKQDGEEKINQIKKALEINKTIDFNNRIIDTRIFSLETSIANILKKLNQKNDSTIEIEKEKTILSQMKIHLQELESEKETKKDDLINYEYAFEVIRDGGVKSKIIKHYLPAMNKQINKYLSSMDFFAQFHLDEDFNETIKSRHRDEFTYMNFSEGEKMRIDLALLLAWRDIAKLKNSVNCNLLILDEVFDSSLDSGGTDEVMKLLNNLGLNSNVFVISHKADQILDKFSHVMSFEKKSNFSKLLKS